jgi:hypothetical protein
LRTLLKVSMTPAGQADDDAGEDDQRDAVADAALGDLLAQPHDEHRAGGERQDDHQAEAPAGVEHQRGAARGEFFSRKKAMPSACTKEITTVP